MAWYAYCIAEQSTFPNGRVRRPFLIDTLRGLNGSAVYGFPSGELVVVASDLVPGTPLSQQNVIEHAKVISDCFRARTVLPFKFGTVFESDDALRHAVRGNKRTFTESVSRLRGKAEMHIKLVVREDIAFQSASSDATPHRPGSAFLTQLKETATKDRERQSKARALSVQVHKLFNPEAEEITCKKMGSGVTIDIAHLIDSKAIEKYQTRSNLALKQFKDCEITVSGPWPPYHFAPGKRRQVPNN